MSKEYGKYMFVHPISDQPVWDDDPNKITDYAEDLLSETHLNIDSIWIFEVSKFHVVRRENLNG